MFSVILPLYNKQSSVERSIRSITGQTLTPDELIIVNDGSTDCSGDIARETIRSFNYCKIIDQPNAGVSIARNNGVAMATHDYLAFLDADDWWEPGFLEEMAELVEKHPGAGIYASGYHIIKRGRRRVAPVGLPPGFVSGRVDYFKTYADTLCMPVWTGATVVPKKVFEEAGGFNPRLRLGEDFDLWVRIALKHPVVLLNRPLSNYSQDADPAFRAVGRLHDPATHMLWNLGHLEAEERSNPELKRLLDNLRVYGLLRYYLDDRYREAARSELARVDWSRQPVHERWRYRLPVPVLKAWRTGMKAGAWLKSKAGGDTEGHGAS